MLQLGNYSPQKAKILPLDTVNNAEKDRLFTGLFSCQLCIEQEYELILDEIKQEASTVSRKFIKYGDVECCQKEKSDYHAWKAAPSVCTKVLQLINTRIVSAIVAFAEPQIPCC